MQRFKDEVLDLTSGSDVFSLPIAPAASTDFSNGHPPSQSAKHLWLITPEDVPVALEEGTSGASTQRGYLAHTNLCGAAHAHSGGEAWFRDSFSVWLTGGSGRYPPGTEDELKSVVEAFVASGYRVSCCGWDSELNRPARLFRGDEPWKS